MRMRQHQSGRPTYTHTFLVRADRATCVFVVAAAVAAAAAVLCYVHIRQVGGPQASNNLKREHIGSSAAAADVAKVSQHMLLAR